MKAPRTSSEALSGSTLGMWIFLATECLLFSGIIFPLCLYRQLYPLDFAAGTQFLSLTLGTLNTAILLTSSFFLALAVHFASIDQARLAKKFALGTAALGILFLAFKFYEYDLHYREGLLPALHWTHDDISHPHLQLFFVLYFMSTGLHALHLLIGIGLVSFSPPRNLPLFENVGLYWHFVDVVWIFLFPILYLLGRTP